MHPEFKGMIDLLRGEPIKLTITSNGHSVAVTSDDDLKAFADVEFSIDYPTREEQDAQRGAGNWDLVMEQAARCRRLGVGVTFIAVMMRTNYDRLAAIARVAAGFDAPLRINVYQSVRTDTFALTYEEYWEGFARLFAETDAIAIGEPLVRAMAGLPPRRGGCGVGTVRVTPRATVQPCVYWPGGGQPMDVLMETGEAIVDTEPFEAARSLPPACRGCAYEEPCHGGCAGRRRLMLMLDEPDPYCPVVRGDDRRLAVTMAASRDLPKLESACTTIVVART
jgi:radical SAM protein with 4Fe4S-binding SPASM domain